jgi:transcriptional regulator with PAS, ATPase and Fis domain
MRETLNQALKAARSEANIVLLGESGTGKELVAHAIHAQSARAKHPFVPVDCASLPENLLEAELFGYEKGAFTGAARAKPGLMEAANHGTLFFDEIGELPLALQPKLLRAVQERQQRRVGGLRMINFDIRIISATNRDLRSFVSQGRLREDLFYRLHVLPIHLPPLRERPDGVAALAQHFLAFVLGNPTKETNEQARQMLEKRRFLDEWVKAVNDQGGFGRWHWEVSKNPADLPDLLGRYRQQPAA